MNQELDITNGDLFLKDLVTKAKNDKTREIFDDNLIEILLCTCSVKINILKLGGTRHRKYCVFYQKRKEHLG